MLYPSEFVLTLELYSKDPCQPHTYVHTNKLKFHQIFKHIYENFSSFFSFETFNWDWRSFDIGFQVLTRILSNMEPLSYTITSWVTCLCCVGGGGNTPGPLGGYPPPSLSPA